MEHPLLPLLKDLAPEAPIARFMSGTWSVKQMIEGLERSDPTAVQWEKDVLRISLEFLKRKAERDWKND